MTDLETTNMLTRELQALVGGPYSLRFAPQLLCEGLCAFIGKAAAFTLRSVDDVMGFISSEYERAAVVRLQQGDDRCEGGTAHEVAAFLSLGIGRMPGKKPSHLVLTAALGLLGQLGKAHDMTLDQMRTLIGASHAAVPAKAIDSFQRIAAQSRPS